MILGLLSALALYAVLRTAAGLLGMPVTYDVLVAALTVLIVYPLLHAYMNRGEA